MPDMPSDQAPKLQLYRRERQFAGLETFTARFRDHRYRRHSHEGYVVALITEGREAFYCRGHVHSAGPGDIILINPQSQHDGEAASEVGWGYRVAYPRAAHFTALTGRDTPPYFRRSVVHDPDLAARLAQFHHALDMPQPGLGVEMLWASILIDLCERHTEAPLPSDGPTHDPARIARIEAMLREQAIEGITLDDLGAEIGWSPAHLVRSFQAARGISPLAFALECRLRLAKGLIDTGESLAMASAAAGFTDQSHFSRNFVRAYGFTPGSYRRALPR